MIKLTQILALATLILALFLAQPLAAQVVKEIKSVKLVGDNLGLMYQKKVKNRIYFINQFFDKGNGKTSISYYDLNTQTQHFSKDTIVGSLCNMADFYATDNITVFVCGASKLITLDENGFRPDIKQHDIEFRYADALNDSLLLLWRVHSFHPSNGLTGLFLNLYNVRSNQVVLTKHYPYAEAFFGYSAIEPVYVHHNKIFVASILTGNITEFNENLEPVDTVVLPIFTPERLAKNKSFARYVDSITTCAYQKLRNDKDSSMAHWLYSREVIKLLADSLRNHYPHIMKISDLDTTQYLLVVSEPDKQNKAELIYRINKSQPKIIGRYDYSFKRPSIINVPEDYYKLFVSASRLYAPSYHEGRFYKTYSMPLSDFKPRTSQQLDDYFFDKRNNNSSTPCYLMSIKSPF